jgi:hypothetical protein
MFLLSQKSCNDFGERPGEGSEYVAWSKPLPAIRALVCARRRMNRSGLALLLILTFSPAAKIAAKAKGKLAPEITLIRSA